ncbi:hypothetical protein NLJ89_g3330 [Agrocybe chaxingu]|uniref:DUF985 domain-containing protein n=1 Tax=Agrocybe chaxingu TaxID=84603 RepID=A0A9W8K532_9AGAR|nr:hypothetical protein NLJ89_g3330 [Agrocybe chaxingu]
MTITSAIEHEGVKTSTALIKELGLEEHIEGGYFVLTDSQDQHIPSPFADEKSRPLATSIYYLLAYDRPEGKFHMNKSVTYHVLHQGRAEYTLIQPGNPPTVQKEVMGTNLAAGESRLLVVGTGIWKRSQLLEEDMARAKKGTEEKRERTNCLITEVVVPGFDWEDHNFMRREDLEELFGGEVGGEDRIREFRKWVG